MNTENNYTFLINSLAFLVIVYLGRVQEMFSFLNNIQIAKITLVAVVVTYLMSRNKFSEENEVLSHIPQVKYAIIIFFLAVTTIPFSTWPGGSLNYITHYYLKLFIFIGLLTWCINNENELTRICWALVFAVSFICITSILRPSEVRGRVFVTSTYDPNDMALFLVIALPIIFYMLEDQSGVKKAFLSAVFLVSLIIIMKTGSRGGFVALVAVLFSIAQDKGAGFILKRLPVLLVIFIIVLLFSPESQIDRIKTIFMLEEDYNFTSKGGRLEIWKAGISVILTHPIFGCGIDQFVNVHGKMEGGTWHVAHNSFIQIGAELGIPGLILFMLLIRAAFRSLKDENAFFEKKSLIKGIKGSFYAFCFGGFFLSWAYSYTFYFLIATSVIIQKISINKKLAYDQKN